MYNILSVQNLNLKTHVKQWPITRDLGGGEQETNKKGKVKENNCKSMVNNRPIGRGARKKGQGVKGG